jgi:hypothetical protein
MSRESLRSLQHLEDQIERSLVFPVPGEKSSRSLARSGKVGEVTPVNAPQAESQVDDFIPAFFAWASLSR